MTDAQALQMENLMRNAEDIQCPCGSQLFSQVSKIKRISRIVTGEAKDMVFPLPQLVCYACDKEFNLGDSAPKEEGVIEIPFRGKK